MPLPSPEEQRAMAEVNAELEDLINSPKRRALPEVDYSNPIQGVLNLRAMFSSLGSVPPDPRVIENTYTYTTADGTPLKLVTYVAGSVLKTDSLPLLVWYHGGGGCTGSPDMMPVFCRTVALEHQCVVVCPQYRLAPEFKYPTGLYDCWDALRYIASHAESFNADLAKGFVVGGESYGAVISAITMLRARDEGLSSPITGAFLSAGSYVPSHAVPEQYKQHYLSRFDSICLAAPGLSEPAKKAFDLALQPDYSSPMCRAILWPTGHAKLPRTYFQTCGMDINRDEAFVYRDVLERSNVETKLDVYPGCPHCFWWLFPKTEVTEQWKRDTYNGIAWLLGNDLMNKV